MAFSWFFSAGKCFSCVRSRIAIQWGDGKKKRYWTTIFFILWMHSGYLNGRQARHNRFQDLPTGWAESESAFNRAIEELERRTRERLLEGENDHLVAYLLQSSRFTAEPKIEPALSAMEYLRGNAPAGMVPAAVERRMDRFLKARPGDDVRLAYFQKLFAGRGKPYLIAEYQRTMRFLYEKEGGQAKNLRPADLYQERGYAADTQVEANFAVWSALSVLKSLQPGLRTDRILIIGPGLDLVRTGLLDLFPPQSYQPFAVADAVLSLCLARREYLRVHVLDINPLVVEFFKVFSMCAIRRLSLISGLRQDQLLAPIIAVAILDIIDPPKVLSAVAPVLPPMLLGQNRDQSVGLFPHRRQGIVLQHDHMIPVVAAA
jgi:hypothetical protein